MTDHPHLHRSDIRGYSLLAIQATLGLTRLVETMHHNILRLPAPNGTPTQEPARGITGFVYRGIRGVTQLVGGGLDAVLAQLAPLAENGPSSPERDAVLAALNGVLGDHLAAAGNPLALRMQLRVPDNATPGGKILVYAHGLCMNPQQLRRKGHDHAAALAADAGWTPVYLRYNSGRHISQNGREFAAHLERLLADWPVPIEQLAILGHSMGGLVTRSACHYGAAADHRWLRHLRRIVFLGSPHHGAPLERGGNWLHQVVDASPYTAAFARLGRIRSAGVTDLRHGNLLDEDHAHPDRFAHHHDTRTLVPLPQGVTCHAAAVSLATRPGTPGEQVIGDGLVPVASALGEHKDAGRTLGIPVENRWVGYGMNHLDLLDRAEVYAKVREWLP